MVQEGWQVIWQTGKNYTLQSQHVPSDVKVHTFISDMDLAYAAADVIVSRAGAMSISELCLVGKPTILVPSPNVAEDHQTKNAMALVSRDAAILVTDANIKTDLVKTLKGLVASEERQAQLSQHIFALGKKDAAESIAREVLTFARL
jgi:UDP-N-acetylglucosamine--N-acetylmuramyl-(pentapeptide) pyrophosphoryl-undecaprenol N-acetylglucosamine transferase